MVLNAEERELSVLKSFNSIIIQVDVRQLDFRFVHRLPVDRETVILRGDFNFAGVEIFHRMVRAAMTEF